MSSEELTGWWALFEVHAEDAERRQDELESGNEPLVVHGRDIHQEDDEDDDGQAE